MDFPISAAQLHKSKADYRVGNMAVEPPKQIGGGGNDLKNFIFVHNVVLSVLTGSQPEIIVELLFKFVTV